MSEILSKWLIETATISGMIGITASIVWTVATVLKAIINRNKQTVQDKENPLSSSLLFYVRVS